MSRPKRVWIQRVAGLAIVLALVASCDDDGVNGPNGNGPPPAETPVGELSQALVDVVDQYFTPNAATFGSLEFFTPLIGGLFNLSPSLAPAAALSAGLLQSCVPTELLGITFAYDVQQATYVPTSREGAPADGFRVLLYQVQSGAPVTPLDEIGHLDVSCSALPNVDMTISAEVDGVEVLRLTPTGTFNLQNLSYSFTIPGFVSDPSGSDQLALTAGLNGAIGFSRIEGFEFTVLTDVLVGFGRFDNDLTTDGFELRVVAIKGVSTIEFEFELDAAVSAGGDLSVAESVNPAGGPAPARFFPIGLVKSPPEPADLGIGIVACFSGPYEDPVVDDANEGGGCSFGGLESVSLEMGELQLLEGGYLALLEIQQVLGGFWDLGLSVLGSGSGL